MRSKNLQQPLLYNKTFNNKGSRYPLLDKIKCPYDLQGLDISQLNQLANEIRTRIISVLSINGGHLSSNLGIVEITIALHKIFQSPLDKFIFDTSHQVYTHKLLTGRNSRFDTLRQIKGICGFSHPEESAHDIFFSGHAGTALSLGLGLASNRDLENGNEYIIPILGDATFTCGLTLEALNNLPKNLKRFIVILNDNKMSISQNVGNMKNIFSRLLSNPITNRFYQLLNSLLEKIPTCGGMLATFGRKITESVKNLVSPAIFFEQFGLDYIGPIDGHDIKKLIDTFSAVKNHERPVIIHTLTTKGKGMPIAIANPTPYHGVKSFDVQTGKFHASPIARTTFPKIFGKYILEKARKDPSLVVVTPAMLAGSCLCEMKKEFPKRCIDVGIAEGHCVTYAGALAKNRKKKVIACIYSTFLQRAFDNIFHDVCLQESPVIFALDRASLSGPDGATHHGILDIGFLNSMPNMIIAQPRNGHIMKELFESAFEWQRPCVIRYPNRETTELNLPLKKRKLGEGEILSKGKDFLLIPLGETYNTAFEVKKILSKYNIEPTIFDPIFIKPLDSNMLYELVTSHKYIVTIEENYISAGLGSIFNSFCVENNLSNFAQIINIGIPNTFVHHGKDQDLKKELALDSESIVKRILSELEINKQEYSIAKKL